ncbi:MAG: (d)CMP kinase [Chloroflexi bacterium]|nr:(d)CMP kinase [Chloroflexota bacterium]
MTFPKVIAIDGPVASGKTTVGKALAARLGYRFIDTGMMYRACTLLALRTGVDPDDEVGLANVARATILRFVASLDGDRLLADDEDITDELRPPEVQAAVSSVARVSGVRTAMVAQQQQMAEAGEVVMVGRDIGTKVLPNAAKLYLDASIAERVRRRSAEEQGRVTVEDVRADVEHRDRVDSEREDSPLRAADDALRVETDELDVNGVTERILELLGGGPLGGPATG